MNGKSAGMNMQSLFEDFENDLNTFFYSADSLRFYKNKMKNEDDSTEDDKNEYKNYCRRFEGICTKHNIPYNLENLDYDLGDISKYTFYKLVKDIKREWKNELKKVMEVSPSNTEKICLKKLSKMKIQF